MPHEIVIYHPSLGWLAGNWAFTADLERAIVFSSTEEAESVRQASGVENSTLQFKGAAIAFGDQWDAALLEDLCG